jgi:hypothetical protein
MKLVTQYLADAAKFKHLAGLETDPALKEQLLNQAAAYHKLAETRAKDLGLPLAPGVGGLGTPLSDLTVPKRRKAMARSASLVDAFARSPVSPLTTLASVPVAGRDHARSSIAVAQHSSGGAIQRDHAWA